MPLHLPSHATPKGFLCDCTCLTDGLAVRHSEDGEPSAKSLLRELHHIIGAPVSSSCACPALAHFRSLFAAGSRRAQRMHALARIAREHYARRPCGSTGESERPHVCIGLHAWRIIRTTTLVTDIAELSACSGDAVRRARDALSRCSAPGREAASSPFAHFQLYHAAVTLTHKRGKTYDGASYHAIALDEPRQSECDLSLGELLPSLTRYHSGVLGESAGAMVLGFAAQCLDLPEWLSIASWKQDARGKAPLPCNNLTDAPFGAVPPAYGLNDAPTAFVYSQWNPNYPRQDVRPAWEALYREALNVSLPASSLRHVSRLNVGVTGNRFFEGATHPCCSYFVARQASFRALAKLHALLLARVYLQEEPLEGASSSGTRAAGGRKANGTAQHWWDDRAFAWSRPDWAQIDRTRACWGFEGRSPNHVEGKHYSVPRNEGALSYLGEAGTILWLYLTHRLISLPSPKTQGILPGAKEECRKRAEAPGIHAHYFGLTSLSAIENAYDRTAAAYSLRVEQQ